MIRQRLKNLREEMKKRSIDIYVVPTSDFHESEYVGEYFKAREYITGFTGSQGTAVITMEEAGLWTDGRYFIQGENQLRDTTIDLYKMGEEGVPSEKEFVEEKLKKGGCLGFDGRVVNTKLGENLEKITAEKEGSIWVKEDLIDIIWKERPELPKEKAYVLDKKYAGETPGEKLERLREVMKEKGCTVHIITALDDIAWLFNIRGNDIKNFPVVLSFGVITLNQAYWFVQEEAVGLDVEKHLEEYHITQQRYYEIYNFLQDIGKDECILLDKFSVNFRMFHCLKKDSKVIEEENPTQRMKAVKNPTELENIRNAHIKDGVAVTKFIYWLKQNIGKETITEISALDYLEEKRREQEGFLQPSFDTISAYGKNAAMMHYSPTPENNALLKPEGFLLVDSGGHYLEGSTDITRTITLGKLTHKEKLHFTGVLRGNLNLSAAKFLYGCSGLNLDILARGPLWDLEMNYNCGTGHGIGYLLNVHEGPNGIRWKMVPERNDSGCLEPGMVTTNEPGVYIEGEYGIRTENELICLEGKKNEYGQFLQFETVTYAPIDLDAILPEEMTGREKALLNDYHKLVYEKISPFLTPEEAQWLRENTRKIIT